MKFLVANEGSKTLTSLIIDTAENGKINIFLSCENKSTESF